MKDALCMYVRRFAGCTVQCTGSSGYTQPAREPVLDEVKPILATRGGIRVALGKLADAATESGDKRQQSSDSLRP